MFVELLRLCGGVDKGAGAGASAPAAASAAASAPPAAAFECVLTCRDASPGAASVLAVVQQNHFKRSTHIQLALRAGNDAAVKRYLAARLQLAQAELGAREAALAASLAEGARQQALAESRGADLGRLQGAH